MAKVKRECQRVTLSGPALDRVCVALRLGSRSQLTGERIAERAEMLLRSIAEAADRELAEMNRPAWTPRRQSNRKECNNGQDENETGEA